MEIAQIFSERFGELVRESDLTNDEIARRIGVSAHMLERFIRGEKLPKAQALFEICRLFHVSADYLLGRRESKR